MIDDRRGNMPFAVIAVTLLLLASVAAAVAAEQARVNSGIDSTMDSATGLERALDDVQSYINQELGVIILDISKNDSLGDLDERADAFRERAYDWIDDRFPMGYGEVTVRLNGRTLDLTAESMEISTSDVIGAFVPSYLHGTGSIDVTAVSETGRSSRQLTISTDGSYALPLVAEQGSLFERMVEDNGISVSQIMMYELQSLAQLRVINGYGAKSQYGHGGTDSIITREDVERAYANALDLIGTICFRDPDGNIADDRIDVADALVGEKAYIDLSAFYGQAMMSIVDDIVLKWYEYLSLDRIEDFNEPKLMASRIAMDSLMRFIDGEDPFSAAGYIEKVMELNDIDPAIYRTPGSGTTSLVLDGIRITVENPTRDVLDQSWIRMFNLHYSMDGNYIEEDIRYILNTAAQNMFGGSGGTIVAFDPSDDRSFLESLSSALRMSSYELENELSRNLMETIDKQKSYDPFYSAIADCVMRHAESLADTYELRCRIAEALETSAPDGTDIDTLLESELIDDAIHRYRSKVYDDLSVYERLRSVEGGKKNPFLDTLAQIVSYGLSRTGIVSMVDSRAGMMIDEIIANIGMNPYSCPFELPETDYFVLIDDSGNTTRETMRFVYENDPVVLQPTVVSKRCSHITGPFEDVTVAYTTTFSVRLDDIIDYRIESNGTLSSALGQDYTAAMSGTVRNSISLEISVVSAWGLAGVDYRASDTFAGDLWDILFDLIEPALGPLREIVSLLMDITDFLSRCLTEVTHYVADTVARLVEAMNEPITLISEWIEWAICELLDMYGLDLFLKLNLKEQTVGFDYMGYSIGMTLNVSSLYASTKDLVTIFIRGPLAGTDMEASMSVRCKGEVQSENIFITGKASMSSDDWKVKVSLDPLMKASKHLISISAEIKGVEVTAVLPDLDDYNEIGLTLSRIPGVGEMLNNIPLPALGVKVGLDAGISIKYQAPTAKGLIINEYETNPVGTDNGKEWVELLNNSTEAIDLNGYTLIASSDRSNKKMNLSGSISPGEFLVIYPTFSMVNNSGKLTKNGEGLTLKDPDGTVIDKTGTHKDTSDDGRTWQRSYDASSQWEFKEGTEGRSNGSYISSKFLTVEMAKDIMVESVQDAFDEVDAITDAESLELVMQEIVKSAIDRVIKKIAGCLVEASIFLKVDVSDITSSVSTGIRVALRCDSELVEDVLKYIAGQVEAMAMNMKNPYRIDPVGMFTDNIDLEVTVDSRIGYPSMLARSIEEELPQVDLGVTFRVNMSALTRIIGGDVGKPGIECGVRIIDCPMLIIPGKLSPKSGMDHDMWLLRMNIEWT